MIKTNCQLVSESREGTLRVALEGEIDHHSAVDIRGRIDQMLYRQRPRRLELDLSRIGFMDSSGLGLVMGRLALIRELGGELAVIDPSPAILRIFRLAGMDRLICIETSEVTSKKESEEE